MSDFNYRELDDIDSAIGDSMWDVRDRAKKDECIDGDEEYLTRLASLREKIQRLMDRYPRVSPHRSNTA